MLLNDIIKQVNKLAGNGSSFRLNYNQLKPYIESSIDYISSYLRTPTHSPKEDWENNLILYSIVYSDEYRGVFDSLVSTQPGFYYYEELSSYTYYNNGTHYIINLKDGSYEYDSQIRYIPIIEDIVVSKYNYNLLPDPLIRSALIYLVTSSYLEEEDELESQYRVYQTKAENFLKEYRTTHYSCIDCYW